ncbi:MAG TPA: hypothetical protein VGI55_12890 [Solirubrobacteraceae bacterium]
MTALDDPRERPDRWRLDVVKDVIGPGDDLEYSVTNFGSMPLLFGAACQIEWSTDIGWIRLPLAGWVTAAGITAGPDESSMGLRYPIPDRLAPGRYRLSTRVDLEPPHRTRDSATTLTREFSVELFRESDDE